MLKILQANLNQSLNEDYKRMKLETFPTLFLEAFVVSFAELILQFNPQLILSEIS